MLRTPTSKKVTPFPKLYPRPKRAHLAWAAAALVSLSAPVSLVACGGYDPAAPANEEGRVGTVEQAAVPNKVEYKLNPTVNHVQLHAFTSGMSYAQVSAMAAAIKASVLGSSGAATCRSSTSGARAQLAIQTELPLEEWTAPGLSQSQKLAAFGARIDALTDAGLPVHVLLPIHGAPVGTWLGVDWAAKRNWSNSSYFVPYKPCRTAGSGATYCPYDKIADSFTVPIINYLKNTGRLTRIAVLYVANEWGYDPSYDIVRNAGAVRTEWQAGTDSTARQLRAEALVYTLARILTKARQAAAGGTPVGVKLANVVNANCGWPKVGSADQLSYLLNDLMSPSGDLLGYDLYFSAGDAGYDAANRSRLQPFLSGFAGGKFEIAEFGRICSGAPGSFSQGSRTTAQDISAGALAWGRPSINVFAWNATRSPGGCYALANTANTLYPGAGAEAAGIGARMNEIAGTNWKACQ